MAWLDTQCQKRGFHHVLFKPYQPRDELGLSLSVADLHLISLNPTCQSFICPSKYYGILSAGWPVAYLGNPGADLACEIEKVDLGLVLDLYHIDRWKYQIAQIRQDDARRHQLGLNARHLYEHHYEASLALAQWQQLVERRQRGAGPATSWKRAA